MAQEIVRETHKPNNFGAFSYRPTLPCFLENKGFEAFDTRMPTLSGIMDALRDPNVSKIGVYGMGGIGKTMLVKEVATKAKEENLISEAIIATVSQTPDLKHIQQEIAENLGLILQEESISARANRLQHRLKQENKLLIILDDVWKELDMLEVGICFELHGLRGCKIIFTSRYRDLLCNVMGAEKNFLVEFLSDSEATNLFNKIVGSHIVEKPDFKPLATAVIGECGGLPLVITTVACALKNKDLTDWRDALRQLERSCPTNIEGMSTKVYSSIKLSYNFLGSEEAKKLLLLCSLHQEDALIRVENLFIYCVGWGLFQDVVTLEEARDRVQSLIDKLKSYCLLLDGHNNRTVKVHDVTRDVVISIAAEDNHMYVVTNVAKLEEGQSTKKAITNSSAIFLLDCYCDKLPERLACPKLELFSFENKNPIYPLDNCQSLLIPNQCFEDTKELRALHLNNVVLESLPSSFSSLKNLQTLCLRDCKLSNIAVIGELKNLIALDLSNSNIKELPNQIGELSSLQLLNLADCRHLKVIQPNVISSLIKLEELYMDDVRMNWEKIEAIDSVRINASLTELKNLTQLSTLHLWIINVDILPRDLFDEKLKNYYIKIGNPMYHVNFQNSRSLYLKLKKSSLQHQHGLQMLIKKSEKLVLNEMQGLNNIVNELDGDGFPQLEKLFLFELKDLEKICHGRLTAETLFGKLRVIKVQDCHRLQNLIPFSVKQLEKIKVRRCNMMEEIVVRGREDNDSDIVKDEAVNDIEFPQLHTLNLDSLPRLVQYFRSESD